MSQLPIFLNTSMPKMEQAGIKRSAVKPATYQPQSENSTTVSG